MTTPMPKFKGNFAEVWSIDLTKAKSIEGVPKEKQGLIAAWVIYAPQSHPLWPWLRLTLIHLRPIEGLDDPKIHLEGATHEIVLTALDPKHYPPPLDDIPGNYLTPHNFAAQLLCTSDEAAIKAVEELAMKPLAKGHLNPDTDAIRAWAAIFGDNMIRK
jgi:hypothetical protein